MKIMILSSKHFYNRIPEIKNLLENQGHKLKMPNSYDNPYKELKLKKLDKEEHIKWKSEMMRKDEENIKPQDAVLVLNFEKKGIPNYIGRATFLEVYTAWKITKSLSAPHPKWYSLRWFWENWEKSLLTNFNLKIGDFSRVLNKKIFFYNPLPKCSFTDELIGINPTMINGNLNLIK